MIRLEKDLIDEIHVWRSRLLAEFGNNFDRYCDYLQEQESKNPERLVDQITYNLSSSNRMDQ